MDIIWTIFAVIFAFMVTATVATVLVIGLMSLGLPKTKKKLQEPRESGVSFCLLFIKNDDGVGGQNFTLSAKLDIVVKLCYI